MLKRCYSPRRHGEHRENQSLIRTLCVLCASVVIFSACAGKVKEPSVAGSFYPADEKVLRETVDGFLAKAENSPIDGRLIALISPHAGYPYSGQVAAYTYKHLKERDIETVILIGPSHHKSFKGVSVYAEGSFRTPLGNIRINERIAESLINKDADVAFYPDAYEKEHSLEVQLPFLQRQLKEFRIVPILIGSPTQRSYEYLTGKLTEILREDKKVMIIASTDLSHYHDYDTAVAMDVKVTDAVERVSSEDVERYMRNGEGEMCGGYPVLFTMAVARNLGATNGVLYKYANSGDVTGDKGRVVGYAAMGLYKSPLSPGQKEELLSMARETITSYVRDRKVPEIEPDDKRLKADGAVFVTINRNGNLRGCIGSIQAVMPLYQSVIKNAVSASSNDPRFPPMTKEELSDIDVEVTVLSPLEPLKDVKDIEIGKHGLYMEKGGRSGIFLPQVPVEQGWDLNTYLEQLCKKAGLPEGAWKDGARLYSFTADIIS